MRLPLAAAALLLLAGCTTPSPSPPGEPAGNLLIYEHLVCLSDAETSTASVASDQAQWAALWERLCAAVTQGTSTAAEPPLPAVDFTTRWVLASAWGAQRTGGYTVNITSVEELADTVVVHVERAAPGASCATTQAITHPLDIVIAARVDKPVRFDHKDVVRECGDEPAPPPDDVPPPPSPANPWRFTWEPAAANGQVGPMRFTLRALPNASAPEGWLLPGPYAKLNGSAERQNLTGAGGAWDAELVLGGDPRLTVQWDTGDPEGPGGFDLVPGPSLRLDAGDVPVRGESRRDAADAGEGLNATVAGRNVTAVFSMGTFEGFDCMENATLRNVTAAIEGNVTRVRAVIDTVQSDACLADAPPHTPRVVLAIGPVGTPTVEVAVYSYLSCFCEPRGGWEEDRVTVEVA